MAVFRADRKPRTPSWVAVALPPDEPIDEKELARRHALYEKVMALREKIGLIGVPADELLEQARRDDDDRKQ